MVSIDNKYVFFDEISYETNCFLIGQLRFCTKPPYECGCEIDVLNKIYSNLECFEKLPQRNIITQIEEDTSITIFSPLNIQVRCGNTNFYIQLINHIKIINNEFCTLNASFFEYSPNTPIYGIFISNSSSTNIVWHSALNPINWEFYLSLIYLLIFIIFCTVSIGITIYFKQLQINNMQDQSRVRVRVPTIFEPYIRTFNIDLI